MLLIKVQISFLLFWNFWPTDWAMQQASLLSHWGKKDLCKSGNFKVIQTLWVLLWVKIKHNKKPFSAALAVTFTSSSCYMFSLPPLPFLLCSNHSWEEWGGFSPGNWKQPTWRQSRPGVGLALGSGSRTACFPWGTSTPASLTAVTCPCPRGWLHSSGGLHRPRGCRKPAASPLLPSYCLRWVDQAVRTATSWLTLKVVGTKQALRTENYNHFGKRGQPSLPLLPLPPLNCRPVS